MPKQKTPSKQVLNLIDEINTLSDEINSILNTKQRDRYFEGMAIVHSFIENVLKWLVFTQIIWNRSGGSDSEMKKREVKQIKDYCNRLNFDALLHVGLATGLLKYELFVELNKIKQERNTLVHQYWLYIHKGQRQIFRKKLEKLARIASELVGVFNNLTDEIGLGEEWFFEISRGRNFIAFS